MFTHPHIIDPSSHLLIRKIKSTKYNKCTDNYLILVLYYWIRKRHIVLIKSEVVIYCVKMKMLEWHSESHKNLKFCLRLFIRFCGMARAILGLIFIAYDARRGEQNVSWIFCICFFVLQFDRIHRWSLN